jgi:hypothetical protein
MIREENILKIIEIIEDKFSRDKYSGEANRLKSALGIIYEKEPVDYKSSSYSGSAYRISISVEGNKKTIGYIERTI